MEAVTYQTDFYSWTLEQAELLREAILIGLTVNIWLKSCKA